MFCFSCSSGEYCPEGTGSSKRDTRASMVALAPARFDSGDVGGKGRLNSASETGGSVTSSVIVPPV